MVLNIVFVYDVSQWHNTEYQGAKDCLLDSIWAVSLLPTNLSTVIKSNMMISCVKF